MVRRILYSSNGSLDFRGSSCDNHVSGMQELLGDNQYGIITENSEEGLYNGIKMMLDSNELFRSYQEKAQIRGDSFSTKNTVLAVQELFEELWEKG